MAKQSRNGKTRKADPPVSEAVTAATDEEVRKRAHAIWVEEGMPERREVDHWMRARRELEREAGLD